MWKSRLWIRLKTGSLWIVIHWFLCTWGLSINYVTDYFLNYEPLKHLGIKKFANKKFRREVESTNISLRSPILSPTGQFHLPYIKSCCRPFKNAENKISLRAISQSQSSQRQKGFYSFFFCSSIKPDSIWFPHPWPLI